MSAGAVDVLAVMDRDAADAECYRREAGVPRFAADGVSESTAARAAVAELIEREAAMRAALEEIVRRPNHSILEECAYVGAPTKKWMAERKHYSAGHTDSTREARAIAAAALARVGGAK